MPDSSVPLDPDDRAKIIARFEGIERSMNALRLEIEHLTASPMPPTTEATSIPERVPPALRAEPAPAMRKSTPAAPRQPKPPVSESVLVTRGLLFVGIALLLFGTAYALQLAFQHDLIGPRARVALGLIAGIAVTFAGSRLRKNTYRYFGEGLIALGTGVLYLSLWAAAGPYHFISSLVGCIAMFAVTITLAALAYARQSERIAFLGLIGGYITPLLLGHDPSERVALAAYLLILGGVMLALAQIGRFQLVEAAVMLATVLYANDFAIANDSGWGLRQSLIVATLFFAEFSAALIFGARRNHSPTILHLGLVACNVGLYVLVLGIELDGNRNAHALALLALAAVLLSASATKLLPNTMRLAYGWLALATATIAVPVFFVGESLAQILAVEAAVLGFAGARLRNIWLGIGSASLFSAAGCIAWSETFGDTVSGPAFFSARAATNALFVVAFAITIREASARADRGNRTELQAIGVLWFIANSCALLALSVETIAATDGWPIVTTLGQHGQFALSILWIVYAAAAFFGGLVRHDALWRRVGLAIFGVTVIKVFVYDLSFLDLAFRVLSFGALGIVLVVASALYQRSAARETTTE